MTRSRREVLSQAATLALLGAWSPIVAACSRTTEGVTALRAAEGRPPSASFWALSRLLTGYDSPNPGLGQRLYNDLLSTHPDLDRDVALIHDRLVKTPSTKDAFIDAPRLAALNQQILSGWYLGIIGPKNAPRCIGFESIISYRVVAPTLLPPSYCSGEPDFWVRPPAL